MKNLILLMVTLVALASLVACSPDRVEERVAEEEGTPLTPGPIPELKPVWDGGTITITAGNFATGEDMARAIRNRRDIDANKRLMKMLSENSVPMSREKRTVAITVMTLLEVGFDKPVTITEIRERFRELGCRPLTIQEALELRLQFQDQPDTKTGHKMSAFYVLLSEEETELMQILKDDGSVAICSTGNTYGISVFSHPKKIDPHSPEIKFDLDGFRVNQNINTGTRFACVRVN